MARNKQTRRNARKNNQNLIFGLLGLAVVAVVITGVLTAPSPAETGASLPLEVSVDQARELQTEGALVLDVRTDEEWAAGHVPDAVHIPLDELSARLGELPQDEEIVVICRSGNRSATGRDILLGAGFESVTSVAGGFNQWVASGYPATTGP